MSRQHFFTAALIAIIIAGVILRFINLRSGTQFEWDQAHSVAYPALEIIKQHHFPLIGPRTGIGDLRLPPLYSYLVTPVFYIFHGDPIAGAVSAALFSALTVFILFHLCQNAFGYKTAVFASLLYVTSPLVFSFERIPWNVNLLPLSAILVYFGLHKATEKSSTTLGWTLIGLGWLLAVNSHASAIFLIIPVLIYLIIEKKIRSRNIFLALGILGVGILPLIIFDLRHNFLIFNNLTRFLNHSTGSVIPLSQKVLLSGNIILDFIGSTYLYGAPSWILKTASIVFLYSLYQCRKDETFLVWRKIFIVFIGIYFLGFILYKENPPNYYFLGILPLTIVLITLLYRKLIKILPDLYPVIIIFHALLLIQITITAFKVDPKGLFIKENVIKTIKTAASNQPVNVIYDMELVWNSGYDYLLDYYQVKQDSGSAQRFWLSYPASRFPGKPDYIFGNIALGIPKTVDNVFATKDINLFNDLFLIRASRSWSVIECPDQDNDLYILSPEKEISCGNFSISQSAIIIRNLPDCVLSKQVSPDEKLFVGPRDWYYHVSSDTVITEFEQNRCVTFTEKVLLSQKNFSEEFLTILKSIRKK